MIIAEYGVPTTALISFGRDQGGGINFEMPDRIVGGILRSNKGAHPAIAAK